MTTITTAKPDAKDASVMVSITKIKALPNRVINVNSPDMVELTASIKLQGIIQPPLVRKTKDYYELIAGGRRLAGAIAAGLKEMPVYPRVMTDKEALLAQLSENINRKDLEPMEEAFMYEKLVKEGYDALEISQRTGKSESYVNLRLRLVTLQPGFQKLLTLRLLTLQKALEIARLEKHIQQKISKEVELDKCIKEQRPPSEYALKNTMDSMLCALDTATFDKTKVYPIKDCGNICTTCPMNSANIQVLFPDITAKDRVCTNAPCFNAKTQYAVKVNITEAVKEGLSLVHRPYDKYDAVKTLEQTGLRTFINNLVSSDNIGDRIMPPTKPKRNQYGKEDDKHFKKRTDGYDQQMEAYKKTVTSDKVIRCLVVGSTTEIGFFKPIPKMKVAGKELAPAQQKVRITETLKRGLDIVSSKETEEMYAALDAVEDKFVHDGPLNVVEVLASIFAINEESHDHDDIEDVKWVRTQLDKKALHTKGLNKMLRGLIMQNLRPGKETRPEKDADALLLYELVKIYNPKSHVDILKTYGEVRAKKKGNAEKRIVSLTPTKNAKKS